MLHRLDEFLDQRARKSRHDGWTAALLLAPSVLILGVFGAYPLLSAIQFSLYGGKFGQGTFVGAGNYAQVLGSPEFWRSVMVTVYYTAGTVPLSMVLGFAIAWLLSRAVRGRTGLRTAYFLPYLTSSVAAAMVWRALLNPQDGGINRWMECLGLPAQQWLFEPRGVLHLLTGGWAPATWGPSLALCCIIAFDVWHSLGYVMAVFLAGLTAMPPELEDAARIDGAGPWRTLRHVTLPLLSPTIFFLGVVASIRALQAFNSFYALSQGGTRALGATENLVMYIYANFYEYGYWGYGSAVAVVLSAGVAALTWLQWRVAGRKVFYS